MLPVLLLLVDVGGWVGMGAFCCGQQFLWQLFLCLA